MQTAKSSAAGTVLMFFVGLIGALVVGWLGFPKLIYSEVAQPITFNHVVHTKEGMACADCHSNGKDGQFLLPTTASCASCHAEPEGKNKEVDKFVNEYVKKNKEVKWAVHQYQPDNVYFTHAAHAGFQCTRCHPDVASTTKAPAVMRNRISGYSKTTMPMPECERCHAETGQSNACYVCHH